MERGLKHGIEDTYLNFEFKIASLGNVVFIDRHIMDVAILFLLTHKNFSSEGEPGFPRVHMFECVYIVAMYVPLRLRFLSLKIYIRLCSRT